MPTEFPILFVPNIPMIGVGMLLVPPICFGIMIFLTVHWLRNSPRPYSAIAFVIACIFAVGVTVLWWNNAMYSLAALMATMLLVMIEVAVRGLARHRVVAAGAVLIVAGYYFFMVSAIISMGV